MSRIFWLLFELFIITAAIIYFLRNAGTILLLLPLAFVVLIAVGYVVNLKKK